MSSVNHLEKLNAVSSYENNKDVVRLIDLPHNVEHHVLSARIVNTKYGKTPIFELDDCVVFLPKRVTSYITKTLDSLNEEKLSIVVEGEIDTGLGNLTPKFKFIERSKH